MTITIGSQLGPYHVEEPIGSGSFAIVYRAYDPRIDDMVAIKVLADNHAIDPEIRIRFSDEARMLRSINSPTIATVFDVGTCENGQPFLVLEHANRGSLADRCDADRLTTNHDVYRLIDFFEEALTTIHERGLVHRDIKPANILLRAASADSGDNDSLVGDDEHLLLSDFGVAKDLDAASGLTIGAGTSLYAAPEQRNRISMVDGRADLYSATAVIAETLIGAPAPGDSWSDHLRANAPASPFVEALLRGVEDDPDDRPSSPDRWAADLRAGFEGFAPTEDTPRRWRRSSVAAVIAVVGLLVGGALGVWFNRITDGSESGQTAGTDPSTATEVTVGDGAASDGTSADETGGIDDPVRPPKLEQGELDADTSDEEPSDPDFPQLEPVAASSGTADELLVASATSLVPNDEGWVVYECDLSHMDNLAPITGGGDEIHWTYYGNTDAGSVPASSLADTGNSTCMGGTVNRSSYWTSTLYDPATGFPVPIDELSVIYMSGPASLTPADIEPIPPGMVLELGNPLARSEAEAQRTVVWGCGTSEEGASVTIPRCADGERLFLTLRFPQCWDGVVPGDNRPWSVVYASGEGCPSSHARVLPSVRTKLRFDVEAVPDTSALRVSTDPIGVEQGGLTTSGGFVHAWQTPVFERIVAACVAASNDCSLGGVDGEARLAMQPN